MKENKLKTINTVHKAKAFILPNGETVSFNSPESRLNDHVLTLGGSSSGKTRSYVTPNLLTMNGSYIVADPKGNLYTKWSEAFRRRGYKVHHLNFIHPEQSDRYNPLKYIKSTNDVQKLAHQIVYSGNRRGVTANYDPFWDRSSEILLAALIGYEFENRQLGRSCGDLNEVISLLSQIEPRKWENDEVTLIDRIFNSFSRSYQDNTGHESWAYQQFIKFRQTPDRTMGCILMTLQSILGCFDTEEMRGLLSAGGDIDLVSIGQKETIVFVEISDTDRSKDAIANLFYCQAINQLCSYADEQCENSRLPVPVRFILDDFGTNCKIEGFEDMISNIRSRNISAAIILQSTGQLFAGYGESAHTIIDNCDTILYLGGNDVNTARMISQRCNKPLNRVLNMPAGTNWIIRRGEEPRHSRTVDLSEYDTAEYENPPCKPRRRQASELPASEKSCS